MAAAAEVQVQEAAPKKVRGIQQLEQLVKARLGKVQDGVKGFEKELRDRAGDFRKSVEEFQTMAATRLGTLKGAVSLEVVKARFGTTTQTVTQHAERLIADSVRATEAAVEKLGARVIELPVLAQLVSTPTARHAFERVQSRIGEMRSRFETQGMAPETKAVTVASEKNLE